MMAQQLQARLSGDARLAAAAGWRMVRLTLTEHSDEARARRVAGGAFVIRVASAALAFLSQAFLARWMGGDEFGAYAYVWTWALLFGSVADFGLGTAAQRFIPHYAAGALDLLRGFIRASRLLAVGLASAVALVGAGAVALLAPWLDRPLVLPLLLACVTVPLHGLACVQDGVARSFNWIDLALLPIYVLRPIGMLLLMAGAHKLGFPTTAVTAVAAAVAATFFATLAQLLVLNRRLSRELAPGPRRYAAATWLSTSLPIFMAGGFYFLLTYIDVLALELFRPVHEVGVYFAATKTLALVAFVYFSVSAAVAHKFSEYHAAQDRERLAAFLADAIRWTFWPSLAMVGVILALGRPILWLFGPAYLDGYPLLFILSLGLLARAAVGPIERLLNMLGEQKICALVYAGAFACNVVLCFFLIPRFGSTGAATATAAALSFESVALFLVTKRRLGFHVFVWRRRVPAA